MIKLKDSEIKQILPKCISEIPEVQSLSYAINMAIQRLIGYCGKISIYAMIDEATADILDLLAKELNTQYYDTGLPVENKRELIKRTLVWYLSSGTPSAVEELIRSIFGEGEVSEWFEYGDKPYFFKIITNAALTPETDRMFLKMIERVKNVRSHIRAIEIQRTMRQTLYYASVAFSEEYKPPAIIDGYHISRKAEVTIYSGIADETRARPEAILDANTRK